MKPVQHSALFDELVNYARPVLPAQDGIRFISSQDFSSLSMVQEWLVDDLIVRYEPLVLGGPKKCMKTSMLLELAISLAAGFNSRFLKKFGVPRPFRVGVISGESSPLTLKRKAIAICKSKGLELQYLPIDWCFKMPPLTDPETHSKLSQIVRDERLDVMIFDPMYLGLLNEKTHANASNLMQMGQALQKVVDICIPHKCTPILVHHTRKLGKQDGHRILDLDDLSQSGFAEFARQWMLLSRREAYKDGSGRHELWLRAGGSAGHGATWSVDIDEGTASYDPNCAKWDVSVRSPKSVIEQKEDAKEEAAKAKLMGKVQQLLDHLQDHPEGDTQTGIRDAINVSGNIVKEVIKEALEQEKIVGGRVLKGKRHENGYLLNSIMPDNPDNPDG